MFTLSAELKKYGYATMSLDAQAAIERLENDKVLEGQILEEFRPWYLKTPTPGVSSLQSFAAFWIYQTDGLEDYSYGDRVLKFWKSNGM